MPQLFSFPRIINETFFVYCQGLYLVKYNNRDFKETYYVRAWDK
jgi:hypothetical protein